MPGTTTNYGITYAIGVDKVQKYPAEVSQPGAEKIDKILFERLLSLKEHAASFTAATGELIKCTKAITVTLPVPVLNATIGVVANNFATEITAGAAKIYGDYITGVSSVKLVGYGYVILQSDGTNWFIIAGEPKREQTYSAQANYVNGEPRTPSNTRPTFVTITHERSSNSIIEYEALVGGVLIQRGSIIGWGELKAGEHNLGNSFSFIVPPGLTWQVKSTGSGGGLLQFSQLVL